MIITVKCSPKTVGRTIPYRNPRVAITINIRCQFKILTSISGSRIYTLRQIGQILGAFYQIWITHRSRTIAPRHNLCIPFVHFRPCAYSHTQRHGQRKQAFACIYE